MPSPGRTTICALIPLMQEKELPWKDR